MTLGRKIPAPPKEKTEREKRREEKPWPRQIVGKRPGLMEDEKGYWYYIPPPGK
jgi:hypothetical protein